MEPTVKPSTSSFVETVNFLKTIKECQDELAETTSELAANCANLSNAENNVQGSKQIKVVSETSLAVSSGTSHASCSLQRSSLKRSHLDNDCKGLSKKPKRSISFSAVTAYYFPREQGFTCVPSQGGSTLGMALKHSHCEELSLQEHAAQLRRNHKRMLTDIQKKRQDRLMKAALNYEQSEGRDSATESDPSSDDEESETSEMSDSDIDLDTYCFLQPVSTKQRKTLLAEAGVPNIESSEKEDCRVIRLSRETCGCSCELDCNPETCECAMHGIRCQVDRQSFPCNCTKDSCKNPAGRVEFNPFRVRTHFVHTLMRLELEANRSDIQGLHNIEPSSSNSSLWTSSTQLSNHDTLLPSHNEHLHYGYYWNSSQCSLAASACSTELPLNQIVLGSLSTNQHWGSHGYTANYLGDSSYVSVQQPNYIETVADNRHIAAIDPHCNSLPQETIPTCTEPSFTVLRNNSTSESSTETSDPDEVSIGTIMKETIGTAV